MYYIIFNDCWKVLNDDIEKEIRKSKYNIEIIHLKWRYRKTLFFNLGIKILTKINRLEWMIDLTEIKNKNFFEEDKIIYFDIYEEKVLKKINLHQNKGEKIFWLWNKVEGNKILYLKKNFKNIWTFDEGDARKYDLKLTNQFYWHIDNKKYNKKYDFYFIGQNKGRIKKLIQLKNKMKNYEFKIEIILYSLRDKIKHIFNYKKSKVDYYFKLKNYNQIVKNIKQTKCIVELTKESQMGLTLRSLEALFLEKKLITDNINIKKYDFYNENNIYILNRKNDEITEDERENIEKFLKKEYIKISHEIKKEYTLQAWLEKLLKKDIGA